MDVNEVDALEKEYQNANTNKWIGVFIAVFSAFGLLAGLAWGVSANPVVMGVLLGGGIVFSGVCYEKSKKALSKLDMLCFQEFGKPYTLSKSEIFNKKLSR
ncbi:hypothetical protein ACTVQ6_08980 [Klebsiella pneumoniae]|uniref:hypothetical protein n=1 Tax=Klebsiella TaxID=570 RepID=UPI00092DCA1F|nr:MULTISPECIES: hypothetical protein [Klebsiella]APM30463.1 hypothetical protein AGH21_07375 [Klebsiella oxytoca]MBM7228207.1 hypothetical protein [Klebsiella michiganensis]MCQ0496609.1 hypothetical protein [Klebsiella pneumoniae]MDQ4328265.1 hypothetical protein [Klebsiella michiganensis]HBT1950211.1 hypothetical protein [Klebsiella pneumoniae]